MAFMLPFIGGVGGAIIGFVAGYSYSSSNTEQSKIHDGIKTQINEEEYVMSINDLRDLKHKSPHKELTEEIINFKTTELNKVEQKKYQRQESEMIKKIRESMENRRIVIDPHS